MDPGVPRGQRASSLAETLTGSTIPTPSSPSLVIIGDSVELPDTLSTRLRVASPPPLSVLQIVPLARPALQLPPPRVHDQLTVALVELGAPSSLNSHCTGPAELATEAGQRTAVVVAPIDGANVAAAAAAATAIKPTGRRTLTGPR